MPRLKSLYLVKKSITVRLMVGPVVAYQLQKLCTDFVHLTALMFPVKMRWSTCLLVAPCVKTLVYSRYPESHRRQGICRSKIPDISHLRLASTQDSPYLIPARV